jgi:hypothetical protein
MKRERALQVVLVLVGLIYSFWFYLLFDNLWHAKWLSGHCDVMPMFLSLNTALGPCLLLAVKHPARHRLMIAYGEIQNLNLVCGDCTCDRPHRRRCTQHLPLSSSTSKRPGRLVHRPPERRGLVARLA